MAGVSFQNILSIQTGNDTVASHLPPPLPSYAPSQHRLRESTRLWYRQASIPGPEILLQGHLPRAEGRMHENVCPIVR